MDVKQVQTTLWVACQGKPSSFADRYSISEEIVRQVMFGDREPTAAILDALGLERVVSYRECDSDTHPQGEDREDGLRAEQG